MKKLVKPILGALRAGQRVILVTVVDSNGSTPRKAGSVMAVFEDAHSEGTVGGGALEFEAQTVARGMADMPPFSQTVGYSLSSDETGDVCMICGGDVFVHYHTVAPGADAVALFERVEAASARDSDGWLVWRIAENELTRLTVCGAADAEEEFLPFLRRKPFLSEGEPRFYTLPLSDAGHLYIFGGGHIARELVPLAARVGFPCVVYEDREDFAAAALFPDAKRVVRGDFKRIGEKLKITAAYYVVILKLGHKADFEVLEQTLRMDALYVGCIGSRRKIEILKTRLREAGVTAAQLARLRSPIGVEIKAETPEEIAVSIVGELILFRAEHAG
jgi:xanthine dehydrogenase accessory factor